jgi:hypothetical protein
MTAIHPDRIAVLLLVCEVNQRLTHGDALHILGATQLAALAPSSPSPHCPSHRQLRRSFCHSAAEFPK